MWLRAVPPPARSYAFLDLEDCLRTLPSCMCWVEVALKPLLGNSPQKLAKSSQAVELFCNMDVSTETCQMTDPNNVAFALQSFVQPRCIGSQESAASVLERGCWLNLFLPEAVCGVFMCGKQLKASLGFANYNAVLACLHLPARPSRFPHRGGHQLT